MIPRVHSGEGFGIALKVGSKVFPIRIGGKQARLLNSLIDAFDYFGKMEGSGRVQVMKSGSGAAVGTVDPPVRFWKITGGGTGGVYTAIEVVKISGQYYQSIGAQSITNLIEVNGVTTLPTGYIAEATLSGSSVEWLFQAVRNGGSCTGTLNFSFYGCPDYTYVCPPNQCPTSCPDGSGQAVQTGIAYTVVNSSGTTVCSGTTTATLNSYGTQVSCTGLARGTYTVTATGSRYTSFSQTIVVGCVIQKFAFYLTPATGYLCCIAPNSAPCTSPIASTLYLTDPDGVQVTMYGSYVLNYNYGDNQSGCATVWYGCRTISMSGFSPVYGTCSSGTVTVAIQYQLTCSFAAGWTLTEFWTICCQGDPCAGTFNPCAWPGPGSCGANGQIASGTISPAFGPGATAAYSPATCLPLSLSFTLPACGSNPSYPSYGNLIAGTATVTE